MDRKDELRKSVRPKSQRTTKGRVQGPPQKQSYSKTDVRFVQGTRKAELIGALGVRELRPGEKVDFLHKGKVVGPPWMGGIFQTRLNWGTFVLAIGFILFIVWLVLMRGEIGG